MINLLRSPPAKPYSRTPKPKGVPPSPPVDPSQESSASSSRDISRECPTYDQYKRVESIYLRSLTSRRRAKALISQETFEKIWVVLRNPSTTAYSPQFRFWVRKMFSLGELPGVMVPGLPFHVESSTVLVMHDGLPIAIEEHMYDIMCYCHQASGHSGRDKTCAVIRKLYSWVPKELVAKFIRQCPTCNIKKCGGEIHPSPASEGLEWPNGQGSPLNELHGKLCTLAEERMTDADFPEDWNMRLSTGPSPGSSPDCHSMEPSLSQASTTAVESFPLRSHTAPVAHFASSGGNVYSPLSGLGPTTGLFLRDPGPLPMSRFSSSTSSTSSTNSVPMSREVSLYGGLPNGWQYFSDYSDAYGKFLVNKSRNLPVVAERLARGEMIQPRIPSIAPLRRHEAIEVQVKEEEGDEYLALVDTLPPMAKTPSELYSELPSSLHTLRVLQPVEHYVPQIDPSLMEASQGIPSLSSVLGAIPGVEGHSNTTSPISPRRPDSTLEYHPMAV